MAGRSQRRPGAVHRRGRRAAGRRAGRHRRQAGRSEAARSSAICDQRTMLVRGQNNIDVWGHNADRMATCRSPRRFPFKIDIVAAQGAAGPQRLDGPEGRRHAGRGLHGADRAAAALQPAGRRLVGQRSSIPEGPERSRHSADRQRRRGDRRRGRSSSLGRAAHVGDGTVRVLLAARRPERRRASSSSSPSTRRPSSRARKPKSSIKVEKNTRLSRARPRSSWSACPPNTTTAAARDSPRTRPSWSSRSRRPGRRPAGPASSR